MVKKAKGATEHKPPRNMEYRGEYPDAGVLQYVYNWLKSIGFVRITNDGVLPLSWQEIKAWRDITNTKLDAEDAILMHEMSYVYVAQYNKSQNSVCAAPWRAS